jgi:hypothetical protein
MWSDKGKEYPPSAGFVNCAASVGVPEAASSEPSAEGKDYVKKGLWSAEEDATLSKYAKEYLFSGPKKRSRLDWRPVADHIPGRNSKVRIT